jgi:DNA-binding response OmpR family regulator
MQEKAKIFIVEDDLVSAQYLKEILENEGFEVIGAAAGGREALEKLRGCEAEVVLMDIMLCGAMSGSEAAIELRRRCPACRIIFLTAYADEEMIDYAVDAQAFAYLMKPYREREIVATIRTALAQAQTPQKDLPEGSTPLKNGFSFNHRMKRLEKEGKEIPLSPKKLRLVELLARNRNRIVSSEELAMHIWNKPKENSTLRSLITRFHAAIGDEIISNINGVGYTIRP